MNEGPKCGFCWKMGLGQGGSMFLSNGFFFLLSLRCGVHWGRNHEFEHPFLFPMKEGFKVIQSNLI